jgi:vacuolar-type H+-ATPase subunit H
MSAGRLRNQDQDISAAVKVLREQVLSEARQQAEEIMSLNDAVRTMNAELLQQLEDCRNEYERSRAELCAVIAKFTRSIGHVDQSGAAVKYIAERLSYRETALSDMHYHFDRHQ